MQIYLKSLKYVLFQLFMFLLNYGIISLFNRQLLCPYILDIVISDPDA